MQRGIKKTGEKLKNGFKTLTISRRKGKGKGNA